MKLTHLGALKAAEVMLSEWEEVEVLCVGLSSLVWSLAVQTFLSFEEIQQRDERCCADGKMS